MNVTLHICVVFVRVCLLTGTHVHPSVYLSVHPSVSLFVCQSDREYVGVLVCPSVSQSVSMSVCQSDREYVCVFVCPSVSQSVSLSVCQYVLVSKWNVLHVNTHRTILLRIYLYSLSFQTHFPSVQFNNLLLRCLFFKNIINNTSNILYTYVHIDRAANCPLFKLGISREAALVDTLNNLHFKFLV